MHTLHKSFIWAIPNTGVQMKSVEWGRSTLLSQFCVEAKGIVHSEYPEALEAPTIGDCLIAKFCCS